MITVEYIRHADASEEQLMDICRFKNLNWNYPLDSHRNWLRKNLMDDDTHLLLIENNKLIGYLNIVNVGISADNKIMPALGIGNVCIHPDCKGLGLGLLIMASAKYFCRKNNRMGILLCQDKNKPFYDACNWHRFKGPIALPGHDNSTHINFYSTEPLQVETIKCFRDF